MLVTYREIGGRYLFHQLVLCVLCHSCSSIYSELIYIQAYICIIRRDIKSVPAALDSVSVSYL